MAIIGVLLMIKNKYSNNCYFVQISIDFIKNYLLLKYVCYNISEVEVLHYWRFTTVKCERKIIGDSLPLSVSKKCKVNISPE